ncbi:MAG: hypothetical protein JNL68_15445, partial [Burkholderiales bacterium]|nr:hypothetical protein [Burkholderiales bacterium]
MEQQVDMLIEPARLFLRQVANLLPRLGVGVVVLIAGWLLARFARFAVTRGLRAINFNVLAERAGLDGFLKQGGVEVDTVGILGLLVYWLVLLAALFIAASGLGLVNVTDLIARIMLFVPKVMVTVLILAFGAYFARFIGASIISYCKNAGVRDGELLGRLAQYIVLAFVVLISLDHLGVGGDIIRQTFLIVLGGVVLALALAFGIGGQRWAAELLERWWPRRPD